MTLLDLCKEYGIRTGEINYQEYESLRPSSDEVIDTLVSLCAPFNGGITIIGGQTIHRELLGFRQMRRHSSDIDCVATIEGVRQVISSFNRQFFYAEKYDVLFFEYGGFPVAFAVGKIHDWEIPNDFHETTMVLNPRKGNVRVASPEYTIMLKIRRGNCNDRFFGKDKLDILNLLLAPCFRGDLRKIDYRTVADLTYRNVITSFERIKNWLSKISETVIHLKKREMTLFNNIYNDLIDAFKERYSD